jgi:hypothetical protein
LCRSLFAGMTGVVDIFASELRANSPDDLRFSSVLVRGSGPSSAINLGCRVVDSVRETDRWSTHCPALLSFSCCS